MSITERLARSAWAANVAHERHDRCGWHPQLTEVLSDGQGIGPRWQDSTSWPGGDPCVLLGDWLVGPETTHLILVTEAEAFTSAGSAPVRTVVCVSHVGEVTVLAGDSHVPAVLELDGSGGEVVAAMWATFDRSELVVELG